MEIKAKAQAASMMISHHSTLVTIVDGHFPSPLQSTENSSQTMPHITENDNGIIMDYTTPQPTGNHSRPLPPMPLHPSLCHPPVLDEDFAYKSPITKNTSGEMTLDKLIAVLDPNMELPQPNTFVNMDCHKAQRKSEKQNKNKMDIEETIKHVLLIPLHAAAKAQPVADNDKLTVEELLALEGRAGIAAWVDKLEGIGQTMNHVGSDIQENKDVCFESISKCRSVGKYMECILLSTKQRSQGYRKQQMQCAQEIFFPEHGAEEHREEKQVKAEALDLKWM
ncbi:hypothetical protein C0995_013377 [Termitomyces sp. Mi166|nr:hypothetical protein C0995_013377 [Termitomyces sp. Mi166\